MSKLLNIKSSTITSAICGSVGGCALGGAFGLSDAHGYVSIIGSIVAFFIIIVLNGDR